MISRVPIFPIVSYSGSPLQKMKITTSRIVPHFSTTAEMLPLMKDEEVMVSFDFTSL